jgi:TATA-box binding protein (TBP) (component of TFIID and TFIIIB)
VEVEGMKGIVTVFASGVMISVGSRSVEEPQGALTMAYNGLKSCKAFT